MTKVTFEPIATHDQPSDEEKSDLASLRVAHTIAASMKVFMDEVNEETVDQQLRRPRGLQALRARPGADHPDDRMGRAPAFRYSHQWELGDFVIWDNCGLRRRVAPYDENSGRTMHRTTLAGLERVVRGLDSIALPRLSSRTASTRLPG